uniref:Zinc finger protein 1 homolog isoform X1 n=1 Tax=Petromyzon marinus TaxID=7757 RepID=A0AAJ7T3M8_PETMA|nr:zinc finger protein 1 homolog isoform X1 [Petromyzon marinus]
MACAVAAPVLELSGDFPAWLEAQGVNAEVARAMDSELGIRDYGVLRACVRDGLVRAELLSTARDRLPFGFYAVLRQVVKALQGAEPHDAGTARWDDAVSSPGNVTLGGLVDVLLALFSGLSRELLMSVQRLDDMDNHKYVVASASSTGSVNSVGMEEEIHPCEDNAKGEKNSTTVTNDSKPNSIGKLIKSEPREGDHLLGFHPHVVQNNTTLPESGANLACAARDEPHVLPRALLEEAQQEESAATSVTKNTSTQQLEIRKIRNVMTNQKQPPTVSETRSHEFELEADPVRNPQAESSGVKPHWCVVCKSSFLSPSELEAHLCRHTGKKVHRCEVCGRVFLQATGLTIHLRTHTGKAPYTCEVCGDGFWQSSDLKIHLCKHTGEKPYQCEVCGRGFYRVFERKVHMRTHTGEKPHICQVCGHRFLRSSELRIHTRIHTGEKPYVCKVCGHEFSISNDLKKHLRTHTGEKPYSCSVCGQCFAQRSHVKSHERSKHCLGESQKDD